MWKPQSNPHHSPRHNEAGNVFFIVMIGVVLFAALGFTFSRSARMGGENISERQAQLAAEDILTYAQQVERGVQRIMRNGFSEVDISFENDAVTGYTNANCTSDDCKVFASSGGAVTWRTPPDGVNDGSPYIFTHNRMGTFDNSVNLGTSADDLVLMLPNLSYALCTAINKKISGATLWESGGSHSMQKFTGSYTNVATGINRGNNPDLPHAGCFCDVGGSCIDAAPRYFYFLLYER